MQPIRLKDITQTKPNAKPNHRTASILNVTTSMSQHQCLNTDSTLKTTKPTKTPKIPNRQKSFVNAVNKTKTPKTSAKNSRQKFPRHKKIPTKIPKQQKFPTKKIKNGTLRKTLRLDQPELFFIANLLP
jgi:hypothetical protein